jgi:hypothetical protein
VPPQVASRRNERAPTRGVEEIEAWVEQGARAGSPPAPQRTWSPQASPQASARAVAGTLVRPAGMMPVDGRSDRWVERYRDSIMEKARDCMYEFPSGWSRAQRALTRGVKDT